jgi:hypothetical protein
MTTCEMLEIGDLIYTSVTLTVVKEVPAWLGPTSGLRTASLFLPI